MKRSDDRKNRYHEDDEIQSNIVEAFVNYYRVSQVWRNRRTRTSAIEVKAWLHVIKKECSRRAKFLSEWGSEVHRDEGKRGVLQTPTGASAASISNKQRQVNTEPYEFTLDELGIDFDISNLGTEWDRIKKYHSSRRTRDINMKKD